MRASVTGDDALFFLGCGLPSPLPSEPGDRGARAPSPTGQSVDFSGLGRPLAGMSITDRHQVPERRRFVRDRLEQGFAPPRGPRPNRSAHTGRLPICTTGDQPPPPLPAWREALQDGYRRRSRTVFGARSSSEVGQLREKGMLDNFFRPRALRGTPASGFPPLKKGGSRGDSSGLSRCRYPAR